MLERLLFLVLNWVVLVGCFAATGYRFGKGSPSVLVVILLWVLLGGVVFVRIKRKDVGIGQVMASLVWASCLLPLYCPRSERYWFDTQYTFLILFVVMLFLGGIDLWRVFKRKCD